MQATGSGQEEAGCERGRRKESFLGLPVPIRRVFFWVTNVQISGHWILSDPNTQIQKAALA